MVVQILWIGRSGGGGRFAKVIGGAAAGQMVHPRGETSVVTIGVAVLQHSLENDLGDVLGCRAVSDQFSEESKQRSMMAFEQFAQCVEFAVANRKHQFMIGERFGNGWHGGRMVFNHAWLRMRTNIWKIGDHGFGRTCLALQQTPRVAKGYKQRSTAGQDRQNSAVHRR